jgi:hypothetical protein
MRVIFCFLCLLLLGRPAAAQCLTLAELLSLSTTPRPESAALLAESLPIWVAKGPVLPGDTESYWVLPSPNSNGVDDSLVVGWLSLRPVRDVFDVLYKSDQGSCLEALRRELARAHYPATLITTLGGEGVRFSAPTFSVSLYIRTKKPFPYVVVLRQNAPGAAPEKIPPANRRVLTPAGVPRVQPRY